MRLVSFSEKYRSVGAEVLDENPDEPESAGDNRHEEVEEEVEESVVLASSHDDSPFKRKIRNHLPIYQMAVQVSLSNEGLFSSLQ